MADFRRWFTVLAVMALTVGLASAQVGIGGSNGGSPFTCAVQNVTVTPNLRSEGFAEQTGDIVLVCTGGSPLAVGTVIPTVDITVYYNVTAVTSRLLTSINGTSGMNASEALLLIDEPNGGNLNSQSGYGPLLPQMLCNYPATGAGPNGCPQVVGTALVNGNYFPGVPILSGTSLTGGTPGPNMYAGVVGGSSVTFNGIPVLPPATAGFSRVYRITNVRVNANGLGSASGPGQINASISISGATSLPIQNPNPIVAYVTRGLNSSVTGAVGFTQCVGPSVAFAGILNFQENFDTAFKTRIDASKTPAITSNVQAPGGLIQNIPGNPYNAESNFVANGQNQSSIGGSAATVTSGSFTAGLADYGTRLKAVFSNVPTGATVYVSTTNVVTGNNALSTTGAVVNPASPTTATSYAVLLMTGAEGTSDGTAGVTPAVFTNTFMGTNQINLFAMTSQGSPLVAVWEVLNTQPTTQETISFAVAISYTSSVTATGSFPPQGSSQIAFSFAPNPTNGAFSATNGPTTAVNTMIPRFADTSGSTGNPIGTFFTVSLCQTVLLFPYVTTVTGFDTGISIANTTTDPFGTTPQQGPCTLYWYNTGGTQPANTATGTVLTGQVLTLAASGATYAGPNFTGYMIAQCYFQLAHGFAVVTDYGAQKILSVYLALVVTTGSGKRNSYSSTNPEALNN